MLPNLIVIGAMRSGTSSLHSYLDLHPQISMSSPKELDFFILEKNWSKGLEWYESHFASEATIRGESSPNYTKCHIFGGVPPRMHTLVPEAKLIYLLRDPVERMLSHYVYNIASGRDNRNFPDVLRDKNSSYVLCSKYYMQLEPYLDHFPKANMLIITSEELLSCRQQILQAIFRFLGVDEAFHSQEFSVVHHDSSSKTKGRKSRMSRLLAKVPGKKTIKALLPFTSRLADTVYSASQKEIVKPVLTEQQRQELADVLGDDICRLKKHIGRDLKHWDPSLLR